MKSSEYRNMMRNIRRVTGLDLPIAAGIAKVIAKWGKNSWELRDKFRDHLELYDSAGCECCGPIYETTAIKGPKGTLDIDRINDPAPRKPSVPMSSPDPVRTIRVKLANVDRALAALRANGVAAMLAQGTPVPSPVNGEMMAVLAINTSGSKAHKILVLAGVTPPVGSKDRAVLDSAV